MSTSPLDLTPSDVPTAPVQNSKPLLVSELVSSYKGMNTSTISDKQLNSDEK